MAQSSRTGPPQRAARDPMIPSMTPVLLKYHTVAPERIVAATLRDLAASGIPERALGRISAARRVTLVACTVLNDHARSYLPASLGGTADGLDASDDTLSLADASFARSPGGEPWGERRHRRLPRPTSPRQRGVCSALHLACRHPRPRGWHSSGPRTQRSPRRRLRRWQHGPRRRQPRRL